MEQGHVAHLLGVLVVMLAAAKLLGAAAKLIGQPAVLGELLAGIVVGGSVLGIVDPKDHVLHVLAELGVVILLFEIGLETDLKKLLKVGGAALAVAVAGVVVPFGLGFAICRALGLEMLPSLVAGAAMTATSVGITARVLSDLGRLQDKESQIVLGAAVIDDVVGLVILAVVIGLTEGREVTPLGIAATTGIAFGFLAATLLIGRLVVPPIVRRLEKIDLPGTPTIFAVIMAFGLAWLADLSGSAMIVGAFAAGLLLHASPNAREFERGVAHLGHFFVPLFFVSVGAAVDLQALNPLDSANHQTLLVGGLLIVAAIIGKFAAGYAPFWMAANKKVIGVGMVPRGEVGLIFAQMGLAGGVFDAGLFGAVTMMVMVTTFFAPPMLKLLLPPPPANVRPPEPEGIEDLV